MVLERAVCACTVVKQCVAPVLQDDDEIEAVEIPKTAEDAPVIVCFSACENFQKPIHENHQIQFHL
eukprot:2928738-Amphidinium_carterae.1